MNASKVRSHLRLTRGVEARGGGLRRFGFTLIELLVCMAVIATLTAIVSATILRARSSYKKTVATSNLRQTLLALNIYEADWDRYPILDVAREVVPRDVTWDPADTWRKSPDEVWGLPLLGSFGYAGFDHGYLEWMSLKMHSQGLAPVIALSIFHESPQITPFRGMTPHPPPGSHGRQVKMPHHVLAGFSDLSVRRTPVGYRTPGQLISWGMLFIQLNLTQVLRQ